MPTLYRNGQQLSPAESALVGFRRRSHDAAAQIVADYWRLKSAGNLTDATNVVKAHQQEFGQIVTACGWGWIVAGDGLMRVPVPKSRPRIKTDQGIPSGANS